MSYAHPTAQATPELHDPILRGERHPDGFVDAMIAAGALVAWADGSVHPVERLAILVYIRRSGLFLLRRRDVLEIFDQRVRELQHEFNLCHAGDLRSARRLLGHQAGLDRAAGSRACRRGQLADAGTPN